MLDDITNAIKRYVICYYRDKDNTIKKGWFVESLEVDFEYNELTWVTDYFMELFDVDDDFDVDEDDELTKEENEYYEMDDMTLLSVNYDDLMENENYYELMTEIIKLDIESSQGNMDALELIDEEINSNHYPSRYDIPQKLWEARSELMEVLEDNHNIIWDSDCGTCGDVCFCFSKRRKKVVSSNNWIKEGF